MATFDDIDYYETKIKKLEAELKEAKSAAIVQSPAPSKDEESIVSDYWELDKKYEALKAKQLNYDERIQELEKKIRDAQDEADNRVEEIKESRDHWQELYEGVSEIISQVSVLIPHLEKLSKENPDLVWPMKVIMEYVNENGLAV